MQVNLEHNYITISFKYDPCVVNILNRIDGNKYNTETKIWKIPTYHVVELIDKLSSKNPTLSEEVKQLYVDKIKKINKTNKIKEYSFNNAENKIFTELNLPLFDYQKIGVGVLCVLGSALLGDEPGLGKTLQTLTTTKIKNSKKTLIVCPSSLKHTWKNEIEKWLPNEKHIIISGTKKERDNLWDNEDSNYVIMNYELLLKDIDKIKTKNWDYIIADEATRLSNPASKQTKFIKKINANNKIAITGTPMNNSIEDIWSIIDFCMPGYFGDYWHFINKYCNKEIIKIRIKTKTGYTYRHISKISSYKNTTELNDKINKCMIRRTKTEVLKELPDKLYENIYFDLSQTELKLYSAIEQRIIEELKEYNLNKVINDKQNKFVFTKILRLMQFTDSPELISDLKTSTKLETLKELLKDILNKNSKAIIFTKFSEMADILLKELVDYKPTIISGRIDNESREKNKNYFNTNNECKIIIMTEAGGMGLNLQSANYVVHYDLPWSISKLQQREDRAHRIGQKNNVTVFKLIAKNTIDEHVLDVLKYKEKIAKKILTSDYKIVKYSTTNAIIKKLIR